MNSYLAGQENEDCIGKLDSEVVSKVQDSKNIEINTCSISIPDDISLPQTVNPPGKLKLCVGVRVMLTDNISVSDKLSNSSIGTVKHLDKRSKPLCSTIYVTFDSSKAGNSLKDGRLHGELKECVPITAGMRRFLSKKGRSTVIP